MSKWLLRTAGVLQIALAGLHGLMPLGWRTSLAYLTVDDRATMHVFNPVTAHVLLVFAYLLLFHTRTLPTVGVGRAAVLVADSLAGWPLALVCGVIGALIALPMFLERPVLGAQPRPAAH